MQRRKISFAQDLLIEPLEEMFVFHLIKCSNNQINLKKNSFKKQHATGNVELQKKVYRNLFL